MQLHKIYKFLRLVKGTSLNIVRLRGRDEIENFQFISISFCVYKMVRCVNRINVIQEDAKIVFGWNFRFVLYS